MKRTAMWVCVSLILVPLGTPGALAAGHITISRGVTLQIIHRDGQQIRVLTFSPSDAHIRAVPAGLSFPMRAFPSSLAARAGAIATVGGDFSARGGMTDHPLVIGRELWTSGIQRGWSFSSTADGHAYIGRAQLFISVRPKGQAPFQLQDWNAGHPVADHIVAFSRRGGRTQHPLGARHPSRHDPRWCAARLVPKSPPAWSRGQVAVLRNYVVDKQPAVCVKTPLPLSPKNSVVLNARPGTKGGRTLARLDPGDKVEISTNYGHPGVINMVGGMPQVVVDGVKTAPHPPSSTPVPQGPDGSFYGPNPRSALGITKGCEDDSGPCRIFMVTIDGKPGWSKGVRLGWLAEFLQSLHAYQALNLDGGGSTMMWLRNRGPYCQSKRRVGCLINRTAYGERPNIDAVALFSG